MTEPVENGSVPSDEEVELTQSPPPTETYEKVEDLLDKVENYNSVIPDSVTQSILESSGLNDSSPEVRTIILVIFFEKYQKDFIN